MLRMFSDSERCYDSLIVNSVIVKQKWGTQGDVSPRAFLGRPRGENRRSHDMYNVSVLTDSIRAGSELRPFFLGGGQLFPIPPPVFENIIPPSFATMMMLCEKKKKNVRSARVSTRFVDIRRRIRKNANSGDGTETVSYTHLTLPTKA